MKMGQAKRISLRVLFTIGLMAGMISAISSGIALADDTNTTTIEEIEKTSTIYAGEIFVDGKSQLHYLYSSDITITKTVFENLKNSLKDTVFYDMAPVLANDTTAVSGFFRYEGDSQELILKEDRYKPGTNYFGGVDWDWTSPADVAVDYFTGTPGAETKENRGDFISVLRTEPKSDWQLVDNELVKVDTITIYEEKTAVIYTKVNVAASSAGGESGGNIQSASDTATPPAGGESGGGIHPAREGEAASAEERITIGKKPQSVKAKAGKNKVTVTWKKIRKTKKTKNLLSQIKSVQVQYATDKAFTQNVGIKTVGKNKAKAVLKLKKKTTWFIRVRYVGSDGFSNWSRIRKVKTK